MDPKAQPNPKAQPDPESYVARERRLSRMYGKIPSRGDLLHHQLQGRKYFDSGDFALSQADKCSDAGAVKTGSEHPLRSSISHPLSPMPSASNVHDDSPKPHDKHSACDMKHASSLRDGSAVHKSGDARAGDGNGEVGTKPDG